MRSCGECKACCRVFVVPELSPPKDAGVWCSHCRPQDGARGCAIYDSRPQQCVDYLCLWAQGADASDMPEDMRPDRSKLMIQPAAPCDGAPRGWFIAYELVPGAAARGRNAQLLDRMASSGFPVIVMAPDATTVRKFSHADFKPPAHVLAPASAWETAA